MRGSMKVQDYAIISNSTKKLCFIFIIVISVQCQNCVSYDEYIVKYNLTINPQNESYASRKNQYQINCINIAQSNAINGYQMSLDAQYMDLSYEEIKKIRGIAPIKFSSNANKTISTEALHKQDIKVSSVVLPTTYNLVTLGFVTPVQNQQTCGCCWSFATIGMYQSLLKMRNYTYGLSEEASLQCTSNYAPGNRKSSCSGGYFSDALLYLQKVGTVLRDQYPYISGDYGSNDGHKNTPGICSQKNRIMIGTGTTQVYSGLTIELIKYLLYTQGPVMLGIYANQAFNHYSSGIFTGCPSNSNNLINHAVLLVGYNDTERSWLIKNSWSQNWGESGFIRLSYDSDCGISYLLGNLKFTSYNTNPQVIINNPLLLFDNSLGNSQSYHLFYLILITWLMMILF